MAAPPAGSPAPEPPRVISRAAAVYWLHRGIKARRAGEPLATCPFDPNATATDFFLAHWFVKGWWRAGPDR